jgi:hypothetical protein
MEGVPSGKSRAKKEKYILSSQKKFRKNFFADGAEEFPKRFPQKIFFADALQGFFSSGYDKFYFYLENLNWNLLIYCFVSSKFIKAYQFQLRV